MTGSVERQAWGFYFWVLGFFFFGLLGLDFEKID
jgi:hypothetical protein